MTRDGLVEVNETKGETARVSQRGQDFSLQREQPQYEEWGGRNEAGSARRRRQESPDKTYSQVGNTPEPEAAGQQNDDTYRPHEKEQMEAPEWDSSGQPEAGRQVDNLQDAIREPRHTGNVLDNRQFIHGGGKRQKQQRIYNGQTDSAATGQAEPPGHIPPRHEAERLHRDIADTAPPNIIRPADEPHRTRLRFDKEEQATPDTKPRQHGTRYQRHFSDETEKQGETPAAEGATEPEETRDAPASGDLPDDPRPDKTGKLQFSPDEKTPADAATPASKKLTKARDKAAKTSAKLDAAHGKLPMKRRAVIEKGFDEGKGKPTRRLRFENEVKTQHEHLKSPLPLRPVKLGANAAVGYAHKKIYQVEHENVGTQAAHKAELMAEGVGRSALRFHKTAPYRRVAKLERKAAKANIRLSYRQALETNPKLKSNPLSRFMQKQKIKRQYAKAARQARRAAKTARRSGRILVSAGRKLASVIVRNPKTVVVIALFASLILVVMSAVSSCSNLMSGGFSVIFMSSYLAEDADMNAAELVYTEWENTLREDIENAESDHPGFDEYRYFVDEIGHDPRELMAWLTAVYRDFRYADVYDALREAFDEQYLLEFVEEVEVRYRTEYYTDEDGDVHSYEVPYNWYILNIKLTVKPFPEVIEPRLDEAQREHHEQIMESGGNRQYVMSPFAFDWFPYISCYYGYRIHPITGASDFHTGIDIAVASGTSIIAAHDGVVSAAVYGTTGYGYQLTVSGDNGISTRYAHCSALLVSAGQEVKAGDVIALVGSTGQSTGPHLHFEVIKDGATLNPIYFSESGS